jgi:Protein of unknown function (DUF4019)
MNEKLMRRVLWIVMAAGLLLLAATLFGSDDAARRSAQDSAKAWLAVVDSGRYAESWKQASSLFRRQVTAEQWDKALDSVRSPLGKLVARAVRSAEFTRSLPGAPDGEYVVVQYDSSFENKKQGIETVTVMKDGEKGWRVGGYFIK